MPPLPAPATPPPRESSSKIAQIAPDDSLAPSESFELTLPDDPASGKDWYLWAGVLALLVFVAFFPAINGSLLWDDDHHVGLMSALQSLHGLVEIWTPQRGTPQYYPLTFTTFWLEHFIWKENTLGYHLGNLIFHSLSAILIWRLLKRLAIPGAWLAAAIWAIHPLQAESVCWMSERKNVLSGLLFFSSIWFYLEYAGLTPPPARRNPGLSADRTTFLLGDKRLAYAASLGLLILGLLAKTVVCAMPAVMLVLLWWKGRRIWNRRTLLPLAPFFVAGLALSILTVYIESAPDGTVQAHGADWALSPIERLLIAGRGVWFYVVKLLWPQDLTFSYPRPLPSLSAMGSAMYAVQWGYCLAAVAVIGVLWAWRKHIGRGPLAAVLFYGIALFPSLGFINIYPMRYTFVADHYQYLAGLGLIVLAVAAIDLGLRKLAIKPLMLVAPALVVVVAFTWLSHSQAAIYDSALSLYQDTVTKNPDSWMASDNLGIELLKLGEQKERDAANDNLTGQPDAAKDDAQQSALAYQEAEQLFRKALVLRPINYNAHNSLGLLYRQTNRWTEAEAELREAAEMDEVDALDHQLSAPFVNYANVLRHNHPGADVRPWLDWALALAGQPRIRATDLGEAHLAYGDYWFAVAGADSRGNQTEQEIADLMRAIGELNTGLQTVPDDVGSLFDLGRAYQRLGLIDQDRADLAQARGDLKQAADYAYKSHEVDDGLAMEAYTAILTRYPRYVGAAEGMGELYIRNIIARDSLIEASDDLVHAAGFFGTIEKLDPTLKAAAQNMSVVSRQFMTEGLKARDHESTWPPLRQKLDILQSPAVTKADAAGADQAIHDALWPLPANHPLRGPLRELREAIREYTSATASADAATNLHAATANVLKSLPNRQPGRDGITDAMAAATCFEGALTSDDRSAIAWQNLKSTAEILASATAGQTDVPGAGPALDRARFVLALHGAATQPSTQPAMPAAH